MAITFLLFWSPVKSDAHIETATPVAQEAPQISPEVLLDIQVSSIADAIYGAEGRCDKLHGQSGEYGCYQYQSGTWRAYSTLVVGHVLTQTRANERMVTEGMIRIWLEDGKNPRWIFLTWNQGNGDGWGPGTKDCYVGVNKHGVAYDSCDYAERATAFYEEAQRLSLQSLSLVQP